MIVLAINIILLALVIFVLNIMYYSFKEEYKRTKNCFSEYFKNEKIELMKKYKKGVVTKEEYESYSSALNNVIKELDENGTAKD